MRIPCVKKKGLKLFTATADQRIMLGEETFLTTHFPVKFHRYRGQEIKEIWEEQDIIKKITDEEVLENGNRVFILYGAAGSGKSETIRWIESKLSKIKDVNTFRISRTELDPVKIMQKLKSRIDEQLNEDILLRWEILKNKPVTLANSLVWNSLSEILNKDEEIIPISYKLRPLIENNLRRSFSNIDNKKDFQQSIVELITIEELEEIIKSSAININIDYEILRKHLVDRLESEVLGGYNFVDTIKEVGDRLYNKTKQRPILLIDDLVQSMNLYASDLLDFFITIEEGNWDIIIGLTPSSFETTKRGKELLTRINYLDTFDDRIYKLWLTDEFGNESYTINEGNAHLYLRNYLLEYKKLNGYTCNKTCKNYLNCKSIQFNKNEDIALTPLNKDLIQRMFINLFKLKGQARHFVVTVGEYIESLIENRAVDFLKNRVKREKCVEIEDINKKILIESYMPLDTTNHIEIEKKFLWNFGFKYPKKISANVNELIVEEQDYDSTISENILLKDKPELNAVRNWLEDDEVLINKELLKSFRLNIASFLKEFSIRSDIMNRYISKHYGSVRYDQVIEGCKLPISFEGVDEFNGIKISRDLKFNSFHIIKLKDYNPIVQEKVLDELLADKNIRKIIEETNTIHISNIKLFEEQLDIKAEELAFLLYGFIFHIIKLKKYPIILSKYYKHCILNGIPEGWNVLTRTLSTVEIKVIEDFFNDWFQLRENLYDGFKLNRYIKSYKNINDILLRLSLLNVNNLSSYYKVGNKHLKDILDIILKIAKNYYQLLTNNGFKDYCIDILEITKEIDNLGIVDINNLQKKLNSVKLRYIKVGKILDIPEYSSYDDHQKEIEIINDIKLIYPDCISYVVKVEKLEIFKWFNDIKKVYKKLKQDYDYLFEEINKKRNKFHIKDYYIDNNKKTYYALNLNETVDNILRISNEIISISSQLNEIKQIEKLINPETLEEIDQLLEIIQHLRTYDKEFKYDNSQLKYYYLKAKQLINIVEKIAQ